MAQANQNATWALRISSSLLFAKAPELATPSKVQTLSVSMSTMSSPHTENEMFEPP